LLAAPVLAAFAGALARNRSLKKLTITEVQPIVAVILFLVAFGFVSGFIDSFRRR
jgi:hypothetical protein